VIQIGKARRHAGHAPLLLVSAVDFLEARLEDLPDRLNVLVLPARADREHRLLGLVEEFGDVIDALVAQRCDRTARRDERPQRRLLEDDRGVVLGVERGGNGVGEEGQVGRAPDLLELPHLPQTLSNGDEIRGLPPLEQLEDRGVDRPVRTPVEVLRPQPLSHLGDRVAVQQHRAEDALLRLEAVRRDPLQRRRRPPHRPITSRTLRKRCPQRRASPSSAASSRINRIPLATAV